MERETSQQDRRYIKIAGRMIAFFAMSLCAYADIIYIAPTSSQSIEVTQNEAGETQESLYLSTDGINSISGELSFTISAGRTLAGKSGKTRKLSASIGLNGGTGGGIGNAIIPPDTLINQEIDFNTGNDPLIDINYSDNKFDTIEETFTGYVPIQFAVEGSTNVIYGWVEIAASIEMVNRSPDDNDYSKVTVEIIGMAYESNWDEPIAAGAVPEPAVIVLILGAGVGGLATKRMFPDLGKQGDA